MKVFHGPSNAILDCSLFYEVIMVIVNKLRDDILKSVRNLVMIFIEVFNREIVLKSLTLEAPSILGIRVM